MKRRDLSAMCGGLLALCAVACAPDARDRIRVGDEPAASSGGRAGSKSGASAGAAPGSGGSGSANVGTSAGELAVHIEDIHAVKVEIVTLACAGDCADIEAVALGGNPPYAFEWEDGSLNPKRHVCLDADTELSVRTTDTAITDDEFRYDAQTVSSQVTAQVLECGDGGTCAPGPGPLTPESGHYEGTATYTCDNDMMLGGTAPTINNGSIALDLVIDPQGQRQSGHLFMQWGLVVIVVEGELEGTLACDTGAFGADVVGMWGLPGDGPMLGVATGDFTGKVIAKRAGGDGMIAGTFHWSSTMFDGSKGNECDVTYEGTLQP